MANPDRKAEIRHMAAGVFAERGFDAASIRDVAKATGMSLAGLYYYYRGKDEILFDIQNEAFGTLLDSHAEALAGLKEPREKLRAIVRAHLQFFGSNISEMKVMSRESETLNGEFAERVGEKKRRYVRLVRGVLEEMDRKKQFKNKRPDVAVFVLFGMMNWLYTWYDESRDGTPMELADTICEIFLDGVAK